MKQLNDATQQRASQNQHFDLHRNIATAATAMLTLDSDKNMVNAYYAAYQAYDEALQPDVKNSNTEALKAADEAFDRIYIDAYAYARAMTAHPQTAVAEKAKKLLAIFDKFENITRLRYADEASAAHNFLQDIAKLPSETIEALHFAAWQEELTVRSAEFDILRNAAHSEKATRSVGLAKQRRAEMNDAYAVFAQRINALVVINGEEPYAEFINFVNTLIAEVQAKIKARITRAENADKDKPETEETPTDEQPETGTETEETEKV